MRHFSSEYRGDDITTLHESSYCRENTQKISSLHVYVRHVIQYDYKRSFVMQVKIKHGVSTSNFWRIDLTFVCYKTHLHFLYACFYCLMNYFLIVNNVPSPQTAGHILLCLEYCLPAWPHLSSQCRRSYPDGLPSPDMLSD